MGPRALTTPAAVFANSLWNPWLVIVWGLIVMLLVTGLYLLVLRVFSVRNFSFEKATPEARQLAYLSEAWVALMAGTLFTVAWTTASLTSPSGRTFIELFGGSIFLVLGLVFLTRGLRSKPRQKP